MTTEIFTATTDDEINACFAVFAQLRPHLLQQDFLPQVRRQQAQSFQIVALRDYGIIKSAIGFREAEFLFWGKTIYLDDLATLSDARGSGFAGQLMDWLIARARQTGCKSIQLDTGYARHAAHRFYLNKGFTVACHHLSLEV